MAFTNKIKKAIGALPVLGKRKSLNDNRGGTVPKRRRIIISCINNIASKFLPQRPWRLNNILHWTLAQLGIGDDFRTIHEAAAEAAAEAAVANSKIDRRAIHEAAVNSIIIDEINRSRSAREAVAEAAAEAAVNSKIIEQIRALLKK